MNIKKHLLTLLIIFDLIVLTGIYLLCTIRNIPFGDITRDPAATTGNIFIGMLSYLGIILWAATAAICFLSAILLYQIPQKSRFLLYSGLFTTILVIDDAFVMHEEIIPRLLHVPEKFIYLAYVFLIVLYLAVSIRYIYSSLAYPYFIAALFFFGTSIAMDVFFESFPTLALQPLFEDGAKFIGISLWFLFFFEASIKLVTPHITEIQTQNV